MRRAAIVSAMLAAALAACGALEPFATTPRPAEQGQSKEQRVGVCYDTLATKQAEVTAEAQRQCPAGTTARRVDTDYLLLYCPLLLPGRATFACVPEKK